MKILGIDTSSKRCTVCILEDNNMIIELHSDDEKTHSQTLMPLIDEMFKKTDLSLKDIDMLACCVGPGSFTGVRIGISTAKAFADVYNFKTFGVSSLEGLAYNIKEEISLLHTSSAAKTGSSPENSKDCKDYTSQSISLIICSLIDAKNENVYYGLFDENYNKIEELSTCSIDELIDKLKRLDKPIAFVGDGALAYKEKLEQHLCKSLNNFSEINLENNLETSSNNSNNSKDSNLSAYFFEGEKNLASSISIAKFAYNKYVNFENSTVEVQYFNSSLSPMYLRKSQAERSLEERKDN
mgnify:FL=1